MISTQELQSMQWGMGYLKQGSNYGTHDEFDEIVFIHEGDVLEIKPQEAKTLEKLPQVRCTPYV